MDRYAWRHWTCSRRFVRLKLYFIHVINFDKLQILPIVLLTNTKVQIELLIVQPQTNCVQFTYASRLSYY